LQSKGRVEAIARTRGPAGTSDRSSRSTLAVDDRLRL